MIALTEVAQSRMVYSDGNKISTKYTGAITGTYPNGGYLVDNAAYPSGKQVFKHLLRVNPQGGDFSVDGEFFKVVSVDNTDQANPKFNVRVFQIGTGGAWEELAVSQSFTSSVELEIIGVKKQGVVGDVN